MYTIFMIVHVYEVFSNFLDTDENHVHRVLKRQSARQTLNMSEASCE